MRNVLAVVLVGLVAGVACGSAQDGRVGLQASVTTTTTGKTMNLCDRARSGDAVVIAAYEATIGDVRRWADRGEAKVGDGRWPGRSDDEPVHLCWYDGPVGKSPPARPGGPPPPSFDRYATVVTQSLQVDWVIAGYRDHLEPESPTS
jgi:hypothetical protein